MQQIQITQLSPDDLKGIIKGLLRSELEALKDQITFLEDECQIIQHQLTNCEEYQGWVEGPLRTYESGFLQGLAYATRYRFN